MGLKLSSKPPNNCKHQNHNGHYGNGLVQKEATATFGTTITSMLHMFFYVVLVNSHKSCLCIVMLYWPNLIDTCGFSITIPLNNLPYSKIRFKNKIKVSSFVMFDSSFFDFNLQIPSITTGMLYYHHFSRVRFRLKQSGFHILQKTLILKKLLHKHRAFLRLFFNNVCLFGLLAGFMGGLYIL